jgi:hypothetical protein
VFSKRLGTVRDVRPCVALATDVEHLLVAASHRRSAAFEDVGQLLVVVLVLQDDRAAW